MRPKPRDACINTGFSLPQTGEASMPVRLDLDAVNALMADRMGDLARALLDGDPTSRRGDECRYRRKGSLAIIVSGPKRGTWHDHEATLGGDPVGLVAHLRRIPMREAFSWSLAWLGEAQHSSPPAPLQPPVASSCAAREASKTLDLARRLWREAIPADDPASLVPVYLASRGLTLPADAPLRFHPAAPRGAERLPAMIALMTDPVTAKGCGVHRTFFAHDGGGKAAGDAKMMLGKVGIIRLVPDEEVTLGLGLAEGVETSLAVMQRAGWSPVWAAGSAGPIRAFPVLPGIEALTVFADADGTGMNAARECCRRWADAGREARILAPPAGDWDDALPRSGRAA
jgi:hypothetical protein